MKPLAARVRKLFARDRARDASQVSEGRRRHIADTEARDDARRAAVAAGRDLPRFARDEPEE